MTTAEQEQAGNAVTGDFKPPYGSFATLNNLFDRMAEEGGVPARIDRSYLSNLPGSVIATTTHALKVLDLTDDDLRPTPTLVEIIENPDQRKSLLAGVIREKYAAQLALGGRATTAQLEASFRETGMTGSTIRKAIAFFLAAARFADVSISPYFKTPKITSGERKQTRKPDPKPLVPPASNPPAAQTPAVLKDLDPFIIGLVRSLPTPGSVFLPEKQEAWFDTARGIFKLLYETGADSHEARRPSPSAEEDESG